MPERECEACQVYVVAIRAISGLTYQSDGFARHPAVSSKDELLAIAMHDSK